MGPPPVVPRHCRSALADAPESDGYEVVPAADGAEALARCAASRPDLVLLDIMMPKRSGYEVCTELRRTDPLLPILFLTAKATEADAVLGLGLGADDYIAKPFGLSELLARVRAALRRAGAARSGPSGGNAPFPFGPAAVDPARYVLRRPGAPDVPLTDRELGLLRLFAAHPGEVLSRDRLLDELWGVRYAGTTRTLDQHIAQLRRKLDPAASLLETVHGVGYHYRPAS
ncbi:MAG: response regulator transcription factor [Kiritimatiellae bacterium]|nr:response regulator transcription factor [Kiritimatiellia bacterium]